MSPQQHRMSFEELEPLVKSVKATLDHWQGGGAPGAAGASSPLVDKIEAEIRESKGVYEGRPVRT